MAADFEQAIVHVTPVDTTQAERARLSAAAYCVTHDLGAGDLRQLLDQLGLEDA